MGKCIAITSSNILVTTQLSLDPRSHSHSILLSLSLHTTATLTLNYLNSHSTLTSTLNPHYLYSHAKLPQLSLYSQSHSHSKLSHSKLPHSILLLPLRCTISFLTLNYIHSHSTPWSKSGRIVKVYFIIHPLSLHTTLTPLGFHYHSTQPLPSLQSTPLSFHTPYTHTPHYLNFHST